MNLKFHLLTRIALVAVICLITTAVYALYRTDRQAKQQTRITAESIGRQLEVQLLRIDTGFERPGSFPDLDLWKETRTVSGMCVRFISANRDFTRSICQEGTELPTKRWPKGFEKIYRLVFDPGLEVSRRITFNGQDYGLIGVAPDVEMELARAWESVLVLLELSAITIVVVCFLVYVTISRALRPVQSIVAGLEKMRKGDLAVLRKNIEKRRVAEQIGF